MLLIIPLGSSNDGEGQLDAEAPPRVALTLRRYHEAVSAGRLCRVVCSGGSQPNFNPTGTPHWEYMAAALVSGGLPECALIRPGLPALHTVDEALMAREHVLKMHGVEEVVAITSDFHAPRARHLFGVAFGVHARCDVRASVEEHEAGMSGEALEARREHEELGLKTLRTAPFGAWAIFVQEHRLEACNKSIRWSRHMTPAVYDTSEHGPHMVAPPPPSSSNSAQLTKSSQAQTATAIQPADGETAQQNEPQGPQPAMDVS